MKIEKRSRSEHLHQNHYLLGRGDDLKLHYFRLKTLSCWTVSSAFLKNFVFTSATGSTVLPRSRRRKRLVPNAQPSCCCHDARYRFGVPPEPAQFCQRLWPDEPKSERQSYWVWQPGKKFIFINLSSWYSSNQPLLLLYYFYSSFSCQIARMMMIMIMIIMTMILLVIVIMRTRPIVLMMTVVVVVVLLLPLEGHDNFHELEVMSSSFGASSCKRCRRTISCGTCYISKFCPSFLWRCLR